MEKLVFICGSLRSGSTMLHLMLNAHPKINNPGEFDFLFDYIADDGNLPDERTLCRYLQADRVFRSHSLLIDESLSSIELIHSFVEQFKKQNRVLALNIHRNFHRVSLVFPSVKYVHLLRDPRDVARSSIGMGWAGNVYHGVDHWVLSEQSWQEHEMNIKKHQFMAVYYEDLVLKPEQGLRSICDFIGVDYAASMLDYSGVSTYEKPNSELVEQWKHKQSKVEVKSVEYKACRLMKIYGYELTETELINLNIVQKLYFILQNVLVKNIFSFKRYGLFLYIVEKVSRKLSISKLYDWARLRCDVIDTQFLK